MGREMAHKDLGLVLIERFQNMIGENGIVEQPVRNEGRSMFMILAPPKKKWYGWLQNEDPQGWGEAI